MPARAPGSTRPDYFNWPAELQSDLAPAHPQIVVVMIGANDPQDFPGPPDVPYTSPQWNVMYAARVAAFMKLAQSGGATVIWVGMPPMQNTALSAKMSDIDAVDQQQAALRKPAVDFISSWTLLGTAQGDLRRPSSPTPPARWSTCARPTASTSPRPAGRSSPRRC